MQSIQAVVYDDRKKDQAEKLTLYLYHSIDEDPLGQNGRLGVRWNQHEYVATFGRRTSDNHLVYLHTELRDEENGQRQRVHDVLKELGCRTQQKMTLMLDNNCLDLDKAVADHADARNVTSPTLVAESTYQEPVEYFSQVLEVGEIYTRKELQSQFNILDATINNGVFQPRDSRSVWLFVTENKTSDRTAYHDRLVGDVLYFDGQPAGRTDRKIIDHRSLGLELQVFYRRDRNEFPGSGFRYEGTFAYREHTGDNPKAFVIERENMDGGLSPFDPGDISGPDLSDNRVRVPASVVRRRGQNDFRARLLSAYGRQCAVSGSRVVEVLEAAHIFPYRGDPTNHPANGLLLRADFHTLFDLGELAVDPVTRTIVLKPWLESTEYGKYSGERIADPRTPECVPSAEMLKWHMEHIFKRSGLPSEAD